MNDRLTLLLARWAPIHQWFSARPVVTDGVLALALLVITSPLLVVPEIYETPRAATTPVLLLWMIAGVSPIVIRRKWIWASCGMVIMLLFITLWDILAWFTAGYAIIIVAYTVAKQPVRKAIIGTAALWMAATIQIVTINYEQGYGYVIFGLASNYALAIVCFAFGRWVASRRTKDEELRERTLAVEANHAAKVTEAINDERRRIARELHDVVAHHLSVMNVMAAGARRTLRSDPDKAAEALSTIETTGRTTLREMRRLLQVLRSDAEHDADQDDQHLAPQPDLEAIHSLVGQIRGAGLNINLVIDGEPRPLDPGVALTIYRIIQEGLTNTLKHAGPARAGVRIQYTEDSLDLEVSDTGAGPKTVTTGSGRVGHGLVGMRERVSLYGGTLRTGPRPGGGFRIHAVIPIETATAAERA